MILGNGPDEWRELHPGAATGDVITAHNIKQYDEEDAIEANWPHRTM